MRNIALTIITSLLLISVSSCEDMMGDFLEKAPGVDVTEDTIFSSKAEVEKFLASIYQYGIHSTFGYGTNNLIAGPQSTLSAGATDEAETCAAWYDTQKWNNGSLSPNDTYDGRWPYRWIAIRKITVMLDRVDEVPDISREYAAQLKAESKTLRAMNYYEMLKRYGGVPIINQRIQLSDNLKIPRSSVEDVANFILSDLNDETVNALPLNQTGVLKGRIHQGVALALRAKLYLLIARDLFNTDKPYMNFGSNNNLICMGKHDNELWNKAAVAAKDVLDWAKEAGCSLITDQGVTKNYKYQWEQYDNNEIILAEKASGTCGKWSWPWNAISPPNVYPGNSGQSGITVTFNFVKKYEKIDGTEQTWDENGGNDLQAKMAELDPRFAQTIAYNQSYWNKEFPKMEIYEGGRQYPTCSGGFWLHKHYPEIISEEVWTYVPNSTILSLNEFYLNYAEALNEYNNGPTQEAYDAINEIRTRSGMPDIPSGLDYLAFREKVRHERAIELAFDDHRLYDVRHWKIAQNEGVMNGNMWGLKITQIDGSSEFHYEPYVFETRTFSTKMYLEPFPQGEVNKGYLIQNPGY